MYRRGSASPARRRLRVAERLATAGRSDEGIDLAAAVSSPSRRRFPGPGAEPGAAIRLCGQFRRGRGAWRTSRREQALRRRACALEPGCRRQTGVPMSRAANYHWHTDKPYHPAPPLLTMLHAVELPPEGGGDTEFANMALAYDALPEATKRRIAGLRVAFRPAFDREPAARRSSAGAHPPRDRPQIPLYRQPRDAHRRAARSGGRGAACRASGARDAAANSSISTAGARRSGDVGQSVLCCTAPSPATSHPPPPGHAPQRRQRQCAVLNRAVRALPRRLLCA